MYIASNAAKGQEHAHNQQCSKKEKINTCEDISNKINGYLHVHDKEKEIVWFTTKAHFICSLLNTCIIGKNWIFPYLNSVPVRNDLPTHSVIWTIGSQHIYRLTSTCYCGSYHHSTHCSNALEISLLRWYNLQVLQEIFVLSNRPYSSSNSFSMYFNVN